MEQANLITNFLGIKDKNIFITDKYDIRTHLELHGQLDYMSCLQGTGDNVQLPRKALESPTLNLLAYPLLIHLRKRHFKCKECRKMTIIETSSLIMNHQISVAVNQKITQLLIEKQAMPHIVHRLSISTSTVNRKLNEFKFETKRTRI